MGVCLCKDKVPDDQSTAGGGTPSNDSTSPFRGGGGGGGTTALSRSADRPERIRRKILSETVDGLVLETLHVIGSIVDK